MIPRSEFKITSFPHGVTATQIIPTIREGRRDGYSILSVTAQSQPLNSPARSYEFEISKQFLGRIYLLEGQLLAGCTPASMRILLRDELPPLRVDKGRFYPRKVGENEIRRILDGDEVILPITRYIFTLERGTEGVFLRLKNDSGQPILQHIRLQHDEHRSLTM